MLDPRAFLINNKTGRVVATTFIEFLSGNSTTPSICFTDSPDSGLQCNSSGAVNYIKNGVNQGEIAAFGPGTTIAVKSDTTGVSGADQITNMMSLTQAEYNAIGSPDPATFYVITP